MIHFTVENHDGDRTLYLEGTRVLVGWIEQGRSLTDLRSNWTEWRFTPVGPFEPVGQVHRGIAGAYEDARVYAAKLTAPQPYKQNRA